MRRIVLTLLAIMPLILAARTEPPQVEPPEETPPRNFTIRGSNLSITPGDDISYLQFSGGVTCVTAEMELSADVLKLELQTTEVTGGSGFEFPESAGPPEGLVQSPGAVVREMAAQMQIPKARFDESAISKVEAAGKVQVNSRKGFSLVTASLISEDGGRSWAASGRSTLSHCDEDGNCYEIGADYIVYNMPGELAWARGNVSGNYHSGAEAEPVGISAEHVELDIAQSVISASEYLEITYGDYILCCGSLTADIGSNVVQATDSPQLRQPGEGLTASAAEIGIDLNEMVLTARGGVSVTQAGRGIELTAGQLTAYLESEDREHLRLEATGRPHLQQGDSSFDGEQIVIYEAEDGKLIVEVDGPQRARLDLDELTAGKEEGDPPQGEPPSASN